MAVHFADAEHNTDPLTYGHGNAYSDPNANRHCVVVWDSDVDRVTDAVAVRITLWKHHGSHHAVALAVQVCYEREVWLVNSDAF